MTGNGSLSAELADSLGIDEPQNRFTLDSLLILHQVVKKGAAWWQYDDGDHETTLLCVKECCDNLGWVYNRTGHEITVVDYSRFEVKS